MFLVLKDYRCSLRWVGRALGGVDRRSTSRLVMLPCVVPNGWGDGRRMAQGTYLQAHNLTWNKRIFLLPRLHPRRQWRARQPASPAHQLRLYYAIFAEVRGGLLVCMHACGASASVHATACSPPSRLLPTISPSSLARWRRRWARVWSAALCTLTSSATTACWSRCRVRRRGGRRGPRPCWRAQRSQYNILQAYSNQGVSIAEKHVGIRGFRPQMPVPSHYRCLW